MISDKGKVLTKIKAFWSSFSLFHGDPRLGRFPQTYRVRGNRLYGTADVVSSLLKRDEQQTTPRESIRLVLVSIGGRETRDGDGEQRYGSKSLHRRLRESAALDGRTSAGD